QQVTGFSLPGMPTIPPLPWRIARHCTPDPPYRDRFDPRETASESLFEATRSIGDLPSARRNGRFSTPTHLGDMNLPLWASKRYVDGLPVICHFSAWSNSLLRRLRLAGESPSGHVQGAVSTTRRPRLRSKSLSTLRPSASSLAARARISGRRNA